MINKKFKEWLKNSGLTEKQLAYYLHVTVQMINQLKRGVRKPSLKLAWEIEKLTKGEVPMESWIE